MGGIIPDNMEVTIPDMNWYNVVPPSYKLVYKPHDNYSYKYHIIDHSYWSYKPT